MAIKSWLLGEMNDDSGSEVGFLRYLCALGVHDVRAEWSKDYDCRSKMQPMILLIKSHLDVVESE